jgi:hypothetical protein
MDWIDFVAAGANSAPANASTTSKRVIRFIWGNLLGAHFLVARQKAAVWSKNVLETEQRHEIGAGIYIIEEVNRQTGL